MSWASNPDSALSVGWLSSAYPGLGILGSAIPATGDNGGSPVLNDGISPTKEYRWALVTPPASGTITLYEDLSFEFSGAANGIHSATYRLWEDGVDQGTATITLQVGPSYTTIAVTLDNLVGSLASVPVPRTAISATLANVFGSIASQVSPKTSINATLANIVGAVASYPSGSTITTINATLDGVTGSLSSESAPVTGIAAVLGNITGSLASKVSPVTTITATLDHVTGAVSCYPTGSAFTQINAVLGDVLGNLVSSSSGSFTGSLSDADIARIVAALPSAADIAAAVWQRAIENGHTSEQMMRIMFAALAGTSEQAGSTIVFKSADGATSRIIGSFDTANNRVGVILDGH